MLRRARAQQRRRRGQRSRLGSDVPAAAAQRAAHEAFINEERARLEAENARLEQSGVAVPDKVRACQQTKYICLIRHGQGEHNPRKNPLNGKVLVVDPALPQVCFDDYTFTKGDAEGTYIWALLAADGTAVRGTKGELQQRFSAEPDFAGKPGNVPMLFTALLNKKGVQDTAVMNNEYFASRFASALSAQL